MSVEFFKLFGIAFAFSLLLMEVTWFLSSKIKNIGIVDIAWTYGFIPVALIYAIFAPGAALQRVLMLALVSIWSLRLGTHVLTRVARHHPEEDGRYKYLRQQWKNSLPIWFIFFQMQAVLIMFLSVPLLLVAMNPQTTISPWEIIGIIIWLIALGGESLADHQLKVFRADARNKGKICEYGLWNYSRHPNYFFEWVVWIGLAVFALGSPYGWIGLYCPALMLFFLLQITGIPITEKISIQSKGEAYRKYQRTTSALVPWFKKKPAHDLRSTAHHSKS